MDDSMESLVEEKVKDVLKANNEELLRNIGSMISKISATPSSVVSTFEVPKFKRKSNEEQYKQNCKVLAKLDEAEGSLNAQSVQDAKTSIVEAKDILKRRNKLIQLADASELGWKVVAEYESNPIASDSEDEKRIYKAEARASRKAKSEKNRKRRAGPYTRRKLTEPTNTGPSTSRLESKPRPGLCYACGKPGHWKFECQNSSTTNNKISFKSVFESNSSTGDVNLGKTELICSHAVMQLEAENKTEVVAATEDTGEQVVSPVGRLTKSLSSWMSVTDDQYILSVIKDGYKLPFKKAPEEAFLRNNKSARDNKEFVSKEIESLLQKGVISKVTQKPTVVNPLTVAYGRSGKPRLVLDCRHINPCLHLFKVKFEDVSIAQQLFDQYSYLFTFDLKSAYHHIDIFKQHTTYLGFSWMDEKTCFYTFNSLPFGLSTAGHIFTKVLRCFVKYIRFHGHRVIMFLDDGIGGHSDLKQAKLSSVFVQQNLCKLGFLLANDKCDWIPRKIAVWLGHILNYDINKLFITEERICRLEAAMASLLFQTEAEKIRIIPVRHLASLAGQIVSLQSVLGKVVCRKTRYLYKCILSRVSWDSNVLVSEEALEEVQKRQKTERKR